MSTDKSNVGPVLTFYRARLSRAPLAGPVKALAGPGTKPGVAPNSLGRQGGSHLKIFTHLPALSPSYQSQLAPPSLAKILTMHLLSLTFMVGSCVAMSTKMKSPYAYQSNPMARMSMQARHHHSSGNEWNTRSKNPFSYMVGKEFFKNENIHFDGDHFEGPHEELPYEVTQVG